MKKLNDEQGQVVSHVHGPVRVIAVAGAGKTEAIVQRMVALLKQGVQPDRILAVTFGRDAATEMNTRLERMVGRTCARVGTFHSLARQILIAERPEYETWEVDDKGRFRLCIKTAVGYQEMEWKDADTTLIESFISRCMCDLAMPDSDRAMEIAQSFYLRRKGPEAVPVKLLQAYTRAEELRRDRQLLTFDAMLAEAVLILSSDAGARARWGARWDFVQADEFQDSNLAQILFGMLLAQEHRNYMAVGDPAQTIYAWRGAKAEKLVNFELDWPEAKTIIMNRNYRSGGRIIATANHVLDAMDPKTRLPVHMIAERPLEGVVEGRSYADFDAEAEAIAARVTAERNDPGVQLSNYAVLYRTAAQSRALEEAFLAARLPYILSGVNFYERAEVADLLAYLRIASNQGTAEAIQRSLNKPFRYLGKAFLARVATAKGDMELTQDTRSWPDVVRDATLQGGVQKRQRESALEWCGIIDEMTRRMKAFVTQPNAKDSGTPASLLEFAAHATKYVEWLRKEEGDESAENSRVSNVRELIRVASKFRLVGEFLQFVDDTIEAAKRASKESAKIDAVQLMTMHRSKGLEWPTVFLVGVNEQILPHARAEDPEEERRLFYVGVTRARDRLFVSYVRKAVVGNKVRDMTPSRFFAEGQIAIADEDVMTEDPTGTEAA